MPALLLPHEILSMSAQAAIRKIRLAFAKAGCESCIETVWGIGYKWVG